MMSELFLYDRDAGLFKAILNQSTVMQGRYFILANGNEINTSNFSQYISDALAGMQSVTQKYPVCLCMPPRSLPDGVRQTFAFTLFFLTKSGITGQNKIKEIDTDTQVSTHHTWYDWKDMRECATNFVSTLNNVLRTKSSGSLKLSSMFNVLPDGRSIEPLSNLGNDNLSGVRLTFRVEMNIDCEIQDYADAVITIPTADIHPLHKH
jgi:hypothetical protein